MKAWKWLKPIILIVLSVSIIISATNIYLYIKNSYNSQQTNQNIKENIYNLEVQNVVSDSSNNSKADTIVNDTSPVELTPYEKAYNNLLQINNDSVGWITIPDTLIDYPVLQAEDNEYYLDHDINHEETSHGSIFMDWQNSEDDLHTIIYGHNMKDGLMFGDLKRYRNASYYESHPIIEMNLFGKLTHWEIFSVTYSDDSPYCIQFANDQDYAIYFTKLKKDSLYETGVSIQKLDRVLTLSTCTSVYRNARLVLHAKLINSSEE